MVDGRGRPGWVVGITGASGAIYGVRLCEALLMRDIPVHLVVTDSGWRVLSEELGWDAAHRQRTIADKLGRFAVKPSYYPIADIGAPIASGSFRTAGMAIVPCSMGTLSGIAQGASGNLLERAADVMLKEGRRLIVVPRETPLNAIHLENMLKLARLGVGVVPAMPAYYHKPRSIDELVDFLVGKVMDLMGIDNDLFRRWGES
jgi:4-hydroxy-3-polyprenylbenzoate decarboxylase